MKKHGHMFSSQWPLLCSGPAVSPSCERRGFFSAADHVNAHMWTIQGQQVRLKTNDVSGTLDLGVPGGGLQQLSCSEKTLPLVGLLGVSLPQQLIDASHCREVITSFRISYASNAVGRLVWSVRMRPLSCREHTAQNVGGCW